MKKFFSFLFEILKTAIIAALIVIPIRYFLFQPFIVRGASMEPNFQNLDYLIIDEFSYRFREPKRGEVVVFKYPRHPSLRFIKRIVGLPGERIKIKGGKVFVGERPSSAKSTESKEKFKILEESYLQEDIKTVGNIEVLLGEDEYFVLGDNRPFSSDSRRWGSLKKEKIVGRVFLKLWPLSSVGRIETPKY